MSLFSGAELGFSLKDRGLSTGKMLSKKTGIPENINKTK